MTVAVSITASEARLASIAACRSASVRVDSSGCGLNFFPPDLPLLQESNEMIPIKQPTNIINLCFFIAVDFGTDSLLDHCH